jgi:hypothetical protein
MCMLMLPSGRLAWADRRRLGVVRQKPASEAPFVELRACHQPVGKSDPFSAAVRR